MLNQGVKQKSYGGVLRLLYTQWSQTRRETDILLIFFSKHCAREA